MRDACPQFGTAEGGQKWLQMTNTSSEDCLYVNIWRPIPKDHVDDKSKAVLVWIHGGKNADISPHSCANFANHATMFG